MNRSKLVFLVLICLLVSCKKDPADNVTNPVPTDKLTVNVDIKIDNSQVKVFSVIAEDSISNHSEFKIDGVKSENYQMLFAHLGNPQEPIAIGLYDPINNKTTINDTSTIEALALFHPYLFGIDYDQKAAYLEKIKQHSSFHQLLSLYNDALSSNPNNVFEIESNSEFFQILATVVKETLESFNDGFLKSNELKSIGDPPWIEDIAGPEIKILNNRHVFYGAGIYRTNGTLVKAFVINRKEKLVSLNLGWPPRIETGTEETIYRLGDGEFDVMLAKGFDFSKFLDIQDPVGLGTVMNVGQSLIYVIEIMMGHLPFPNLATLPGVIKIETKTAFKISDGIIQKKCDKVLTGVLDLIAYNKEEIAYWVFQEFQTNATHEFINTAASIMKKVTFVFEIMGYVNEEAPFIWDMIVAPSPVKYHITQKNGVILDIKEIVPPEAEFSVNPVAGIIGTDFYFDASLSSDKLFSLNELKFRWDFLADGNWTSWSSNPEISHIYSESGSFSVVLEVKNPNELNSTASHKVNVGGGAGTANHLKVFMDNLPWDSEALYNVLNSFGFTEGPGSDQYEVFNSTQMQAINLVPGKDLVIISNDQEQEFYNNYAKNQSKFATFLSNGGSILWEACDNGWAEGSISVAGIQLPGNVLVNGSLDMYNYVVNPVLPLVNGLPIEMDHNYASHESFYNLSDGTTVYCENSNHEPTLIEFNFNKGWIIFTGQPLEHQYDRIYGNRDVEELLPRIIAYFTGKEYQQPLYPSRPLMESSIPTVHKK